MLKLLPPKTKQKTTFNLDDISCNPVVLLAYAKALCECLDIDFCPPANLCAKGAFAELVREVEKKLGKHLELVTQFPGLLAECR